MKSHRKNWGKSLLRGRTESLELRRKEGSWKSPRKDLSDLDDLVSNGEFPEIKQESLGYATVTKHPLCHPL